MATYRAALVKAKSLKIVFSYLPSSSSSSTLARLSCWILGLRVLVFHPIMLLDVKQSMDKCMDIATNCLLTGQEQACSRITRLVVCLFIWLFECHHAENGQIHRKMAVDYLLVITFIGDTLFQTRPDQQWGKIGQASLSLSWHRVLF